ncbi:MAG: hypothetical protein Q8K99_14475 [Actinomycetota bacterium]|nr:hypothetical protein [Actinomycetota bacterium]
MRRSDDMRRAWSRLALASLLLVGLVVTSLMTGSPAESPAFTWKMHLEKLRYRILPTSEADLVLLHHDALKVSMEKCVACHGSKDESTLPLHRIHLTNELLPGLVCHDCHRTISLEKRTNEYVVRLVDVGFCERCHSPFPGLQPDSPMKPGDLDVDCIKCHSGQSAYRHAQPYLSHVIDPEECRGCHGGRTLPWTAKHKKDDWMQTHGVEALAVGNESCFQCHEFGLKFCDECHAEKPPSHDPRDAWLRDHRQRAQADTRVCFTCHRTEDCKKCHVNHELDWLERHPADVQDKGSVRCWECHSESFCGSCHIEASTQ